MDLEFTKKCWDGIIDYEKSWIKANPNVAYPVVKILQYFGAERICKMHGLDIVDVEIAKILISKAFDK